MEIITIAYWFAYFISLYLIIFWLLVYVEKGAADIPKKLRRKPFVSIVIPAYNEEKNLEYTIGSLLQLQYPKEKIEILVVDDGSKDNTANVARRIIKNNPDWDIQLLQQENKGKGAALNHALRQAKGEYFICLDADSRIEPGALQKMLPEFDDPEVAAVLPAIKVEKPETLVQKIQWFEYTLTLFLKKMMGHLHCTYVTPGPFTIYRKEILKLLGGFDEHNLTEDMEIAFKIQKADYKIIQLINTHAWTKTPGTVNSFYRQRNRWYKGGLHNLMKYKDMIFNPKYGEFGLLQMPLIWVYVLLSTLVFFFVYYRNMIRPLWEEVYNWAFIDYSVDLSLNKMFNEGALLGHDYSTLFLIYAAFAIALVYAFVAFRVNKEKLLKEKLHVPVLYFLLYPIAIFFIWCLILIDLIRGKKQRW